jgi:predicted amidohydrolase
MPRNLTIAAAQLGPAKARGSELVAFPELALTSFFPRWYMEDWREADAFFETTMPSQETQPLFDHARSLGLAFSFGYAELSQGADRLHRYNTSILVDEAGHIAAKYRKIHLPGHANHEPTHPFQHLEKRYGLKRGG